MLREHRHISCFLSLPWPWTHLLIWPQSSCTNWPCNLPTFSSQFKQKTLASGVEGRGHSRVHTFPTPASFPRLPWYLASAPCCSCWLRVQGWWLAGTPSTPGTSLLWTQGWPCSERGWLPAIPHLAPAPPGRHWEPKRAPRADPLGHTSSHPPRTAPRPKRMCDFRYTIHYITLWVFPWSRSAVTLWRWQRPPPSFPKSAETFPLILISI